MQCFLKTQCYFLFFPHFVSYFFLQLFLKINGSNFVTHYLMNNDESEFTREYKVYVNIIIAKFLNTNLFEHIIFEHFTRDRITIFSAEIGKYHCVPIVIFYKPIGFWV